MPGHLGNGTAASLDAMDLSCWNIIIISQRMMPLGAPA
jgi:hypothetical protein